MRRAFFVFSILFILSISFSACQKCTVCTHIDLVTGEEVIEEFCGSGTEVKNFEDEFLVDWDSIGGYCDRN